MGSPLAYKHQIDWKNPNYDAINIERIARLKYLRANPTVVDELKIFYRNGPEGAIAFINDWGCTFDPRNMERELPTTVPFILFPKQEEFIHYVYEHWRGRRPGLAEKSRDCGISWECVSIGAHLGLFYRGTVVGYGSRKEEYVDKVGQPKSLFWKARFFVEKLPEEFRGGWLSWRDAPHMRIHFPETGSVMTGEAGDQIGRGDRASIYFVDEAAYLERPELVEMSLSQTTNCRIDVSSVNGMNNPFAKKRHEGKIEVFVFDWRDDPRKDEAWYAKQCEDLDPVTVAQEIDRDYSASVAGIVIPGEWVRSSLDALEKVGVAPTGKRGMSLDVADEGRDKNALVGARGVQIEYLEQWSGKGGDLFQTTQHAFQVCDEEGYDGIDYDADGLGAGIRGDARIVNEARPGRQLRADGFRGSEKVIDPDAIVEGTQTGDGPGRTNKDYFLNRKSQGWWALRRRFMLTHRWVVGGKRCNPDDIISISTKHEHTKKLYAALVTEMSQVTFKLNNAGKIIINKQPDGMKSPNLADAAMIRFAPKGPPAMNITAAVLNQIQAAGFGRLRRRRRS